MKPSHSFVAVFLLACLSQAIAQPLHKVGFFAPQGVVPEMAEKTDFATMNLVTLQQVESSLAVAQKAQRKFKVNLDLGKLLTDIAPAQGLRMTYQVAGEERRKILAPRADNKLRTLAADSEIAQRLEPFMPIIKQYQAHIDTIFIVDEPYLNGISKAELERAALAVRATFKSYAVPDKKLGVLFASAMFNRDFAQLMAQMPDAYVQNIDGYYRDGGKENPDEWERWKKIIPEVRLTTYDTAGNMFTEGGLPSGFDVFSFDFYLSTVLLDGLHDRTLDYFAKINPDQCKQFSGKTMKTVRKGLSFFQLPTPANTSSAAAKQDKRILQELFTCRMGTVTSLLKKEIRQSYGDKPVRVVLTTEASNNGVLQFSPEGSVLPTQNSQAAEDRVLDEVERAAAFHRQNRAFFNEGVMFFTYHNEYDETIKLNIGGAKSMPRVMRTIASLRRPPAFRR